MTTVSADSAQPIIRQFIHSAINLDGVKDDDNLFAAGIVNSLFAVQLTTFVETRFGLELGMEDLDIENFKSIAATAAFVARKAAAAPA
ncbi:MAG TPA: phosphopantetheine-binding protein [Opitutaceae bacterium]|jgi:acyl carrier protein